ncbi:MAG: hypothetical protein ABSH20_00230 [Tepidisphaeraceae bacterium]|jgi:hypothetical protein
MPPPLPSSSPPPPALSAEHLRQLAAARASAGKIRRAISIARFDGGTIAAFAVLTLLFGIASPVSLILALGMGTVAFVELRAARQLRRLDPAAIRTLAFNQLALGALLILYALVSLYMQYTGPGIYADAAASDPALADALKPFESLSRTLSLAVYALVIVIAIFAQGGLSLFYFSRARHLRAYLAQTPPWIIHLHQADLSL